MRKNDYSEVYSILQFLGEEYINKIPKELYAFIKKNKNENYNPKYNSFEDLKSAHHDTISLIAAFHIKYWSNGEDDKKLKEFFMKK